MTTKGQLPKEKTLDSTLRLLYEGYLYIQNRCNKYNSNIFQTRLFFQNVICMRGEELSRLFYDNRIFTRKGAAPKRVLKTLLGERGVQTLDKKEHRHRKQMFMSLMSEARLDKLKEITMEQWSRSSSKWSNKIVLFDEAQLIMCKVACKWAGVPLNDMEAKQRAADFGSMIDAFGAVGPRHWKGRKARSRAEKWIEGIIHQIRIKKLNPSKETAASVIARHRSLDGKLLPTKIAAVELINIVRPIVAIATYITFEALALHQYPEFRKKLKESNTEFYEMYVQEVRRFYPFAPFVGGRVRKDFIWNNFRFKKGTLVLLDIYGTNHDTQLWGNPEVFTPSHFSNWNNNPYSFIPQGGGDYNINHRCPGEWITIEAMKVSLDFLTNKLNYLVPEQDLSYSLKRIPTLPKDRLLIKII